MRPEHIKVITPLSRGLPKTGQETSYTQYDDGYYEAGWWLGLLNENNRTRFVVKEYEVGYPVVIDLATKLMWPKDITSIICKNSAPCTWHGTFDWLIGREYGSFSDWRLPNLLEFLSLANLNEVSPSTYKTVFTNWTVLLAFWTATTSPTITTKAIKVSFTHGYYCIPIVKTEAWSFIPCRSI